MKKLLNIIGASVILSSSAVVASCSLDPSAPIEINDAIDLQNFFNKLQNNRPELSSDYNVAFDGQNAKYIAALEEIFDQEKVVRTPFIQKLLKADFYDNDKSTIGYDIQKTGQVLGGGSLVRGADHKVIPDVANKKLSDYFYEKVAKPDEKPVDNRVALSTVITSKALGELSDNNGTTIMDAVKKANSELNVNEVEIKNITEESATVAAKSGSTIYSGSVTVTFSTTPVNTTKPLVDDLTDTKLGELADKSESTIKTALTNKNKNLNVNQITITDITDTGATVKVIENSTVYDAGGSVSVTFTLKSEAVELSTIITSEKSNLGEITSPDEAGIKAGLTAKIPELNQEEITITPVDDTSATIAPKDGSTVYTGESVTVTFTLKSEAVELSTIITSEKSNLGEITSPDEVGIKAGLTAKIPELNQEEITITPVDDTSATIAPKDGSTVYTGESVTVTFTLKSEAVELSTIITSEKSNLGEIASPDEAGIKAGLTAKIPELNQEEITITPVDDTSATIAPKDGSTVYTGESVTVTFTLKSEAVELSTIITSEKSNLGEITSPDEAGIKAGLTAKIPELNQEEIKITPVDDTSATIAPKDGSTVYTGESVTVTFTLKSEAVELSTIITSEKSNLGEITSPDEAGIKAGLTAKIPELNQEEIKITPVDDTSATIAPKDGSTVYTGESVTVTFTLKSEAVELSTIITSENSALGEITSPDEAGIKAGLTAKIPELNQEEIKITPVDDTSATIAPKDGSTVYTGDPVTVTFSVAEAPTMNYYSILNVHHLLADGPEYSYDDYTMTIMIGIEDLLNLDNNGYVYIPFTILPE
jgi:preprotein translocase subunit YajC